MPSITYKASSASAMPPKPAMSMGMNLNTTGAAADRRDGRSNSTSAWGHDIAADLAAASTLTQFKILAQKEITTTSKPAMGITRSTQSAESSPPASPSSSAASSVSKSSSSSTREAGSVGRRGISMLPPPFAATPGSIKPTTSILRAGAVRNIPSTALPPPIPPPAGAPISSFIQKQHRIHQRKQGRQRLRQLAPSALGVPIMRRDLGTTAAATASTKFSRRSRTVSLDLPVGDFAHDLALPPMPKVLNKGRKVGPLASTPPLRPMPSLIMPQPLTPLSSGRSLPVGKYSAMSPHMASVAGTIPPPFLLEHHDWKTHSRSDGEASSKARSDVSVSSKKKAKRNKQSGAAHDNSSATSSLPSAASTDAGSHSDLTSDESCTEDEAESITREHDGRYGLEPDSESDDESIDNRASSHLHGAGKHRKRTSHEQRAKKSIRPHKRARTASFRTTDDASATRNTTAPRPVAVLKSLPTKVKAPATAISNKITKNKKQAQPHKQQQLPVKQSKPRHSFVGTSTSAEAIRNVLRKGFSWRQFPELEQFLRDSRDEYFAHSSLNYTMEQRQYNNNLTKQLLKIANDAGYVFEDFTFAMVRDRIRCYYKSYVQAIKKRKQQTKSVASAIAGRSRSVSETA